MARLLPSLLLLALAAPTPAQAYTYISTDGCPAGQGAAWDMSAGPARWWLHEAGYPRMDQADVQRVLQDAFDVWSAPCCSDFQNEYVGTTHRSAMSYLVDEDVVEFTSDWPREWGRNTIAVTLPQIWNDCRIREADMVFNTRDFVFSTDGTATDLQAVATHEFGHWLGLDHSNFPGSSMSRYYSGGMAERTLTSDDESGVCALYTVSCTGCQSDEECDGDWICDRTTGICEAPACSDDPDCPGGTVCRDQRCVPGCRDQSECGEGWLCKQGDCVRDPTFCTICERCMQDADCGGANFLCLPIDGDGGVCTRLCSSHTECPGDSTCWSMQLDGQTTGMCFAPDADTHDLCHDGWSCGTTCTGLWQGCVADDQCGGGKCAETPMGRRCTCVCTADDDCGDGSRCVRTPEGASWCAPVERADDPCLFVTCNDGFFCSEGSCVTSCDGLTCNDGEICEEGACVDACGPCGPAERCDAQTRTCVPEPEPIHPCEDHVCPDTEVCIVRDGAAVCEDPGSEPGTAPCGDLVCKPGYRCEDGTCVDACLDVACPSGSICLDGACVEDSAGKKKRDGGGCAAGGADLAALGLLAALAFVYRRP